MNRILLRLCPAVWGVLFAVFTLSAADLPEKHPLDKSENRTLVLDNGLRVALVSDPDINMASASMAVGVGSFANPDDSQGLAHFLEHMLFLGTEKYPDEDEYGEYLQQNGGYSNAYTASDLTNYHFEVYPNAFEGALDRFAQFFIAPLFTAEFTSREMNAVDSEFEKNKEDDDWRVQYLFATKVRPGHPQNQFSTGNLESLKDVSRDTLIGFYQKYYTANRMALSLVSPLPLDEMEAWVRDYFAPIANQDLPRLSYPSDVFEQKEAYRLLQVQATEDRREFSLVFSLPSLEKDYDAKTGELLSKIVGEEREGSLLSDLKAAGLASGLGGSIWAPSLDYSLLYVSVDLTPTGLENYDQVAQMVLGYFKKMREEPFPQYILDEMATMARLDELYTDKGEGAQRAVALANRALEMPLEDAVRGPYLYRRANPDLYRQLLDRLVPENMLAILLTKDAETDTVEPIYGTRYSFTELTGDRYTALVNAPILPEFTLPIENPFVPKHVAMIPERPIKLIDRPGLELFYGQDTTFERPKVSMTFRFRPVWKNGMTARDDALLDFYQACFNEAVNELSYAASSAGADYSLSTTFESITLSFGGYSESVGTLSKDLIDALKSFTLTETQFAAVKDRMLRDWRNTVYGNAFRFITLYQRQIAQEGSFLPWEKADAADGFTLADIYAFRDQLFGKGQIQALVYGNITADSAIAQTEQIADQLDYTVADDKEIYDTRLLAIEPGEHLVFEDVLPSNNSVFREDVVVGLDTPERRMALAVMSNLLASPYYSELRTRQQLGYVVWSANFNRDKRLQLLFLIQSGDYDPIELKQRSDTFLASFPEMLGQMPPEAFAQAKAAVRSQIEEKPTSIAEKAGRFAALAFEYDEDWGRKEASLNALEALTPEDVATIFEEAMNDASNASTTVYLFARQHADTAESVDGVEDIVAWKAQRTYEKLK